MKNCEICLGINKKTDKNDLIFETEKWRVTLDANQQFLGKCFVTLLAHKSSLSELNEDDWADFEKLVRLLEGSIKKAFQPSHFNWSCLMNFAAMSGQETHVHWHLHPRYDKKIDVAGESFEDTQWYPRKEKVDNFVDQKTLKVIAEKIHESMT